MDFNEFFILLNQKFTLYFVFPSIVVLGLYLSFKLRFLQLTKLKMSLSCLLRKKDEGTGNISHYEAISAVIAGNLGTGNISGMAIAITMGGPGSLVWMWVMAFFGSAIQYSSCFLGVKYRKKDETGEYVGGPMYYLKYGLGYKKIAALFAMVTLLAAITVGNFAQVNSIVLPLQSLGCSPWLSALGIMALSAIAVFGGIQRIAKLASSIVPLIAILYLGACFFILYLHRDALIPALKVMFDAAFGSASFLGGTVGFGVMQALSTGFGRGLFATDAGTGIVPILQSGARTKSPVVDGVVTLIAPFLVMTVCTMTGLILIVTGAFSQNGLQSTNMVIFAFQQVFGSTFGMLLVVTALGLFAYTTIIAWGGCGEKAAQFLWGKSRTKWFQWAYLAFIPIGAVSRVDIVWILADLSISVMLLSNLIGIVGLSKEVIAESKRYFEAERHPIAEIPLEEFP